MIKYFLLISLFFLASCSKNSTPVTPEISPDQKTKTILALGDSLTAGYGLSTTDSYPSQLEIKLWEKGYTYKIVNAGISGDTTAGLLSRLDWVLDWDAPSFVILCIGANDAFQGKDTDEIEKNLRQIIEKIRAKNIPILFAGMRAPLNLGGEYGKRYEAIFPQLAKEYNLVYMDFFLEGVALKAQYNQDDRIHPNKEGYTIVVENLLKVLEGEGMLQK